MVPHPTPAPPPGALTTVDVAPWPSLIVALALSHSLTRGAVTASIRGGAERAAKRESAAAVGVGKSAKAAELQFFKYVMHEMISNMC